MITSSQVTAADTATLLAENTGNIEEHVWIKNLDGANSVFIGPSDVADTTGYELPVGSNASSAVKITLWPGDKIYGIAAATATAVVHVLEVRGSP